MDPKAVLGGLGEKYSSDILRKADDPISVQDLSEDLDIPVTTSYRRVETLERTGLLEEADTEVGKGKRERTVYRRNVEEIVIRFDDEEIVIEPTERDREEEPPIARVWGDLGNTFGGDD